MISQQVIVDYQAILSEGLQVETPIHRYLVTLVLHFVAVDFVLEELKSIEDICTYIYSLVNTYMYIYKV